ncbi:hypothetical protein [Luteimonas sp. A478]
MATTAPVSQASGLSATNTWPATLEADVRAFHAALGDRHPGPVDPENPDFRRHLDEALEQTLERVPDARDYGAYWWALREFRASFNDGHVQLGQTGTAPPLTMRWPGFLAGQRDGHHEVMVRLDEAGLPVEGARLVDCEGVAANDMAEARLGRFYGRWQLAAQRKALSGRLFLDQGNPWLASPRECRFERNGQVDTVQLQWRALGEGEASTMLAAMRGAPPSNTGIRRVDDGNLLWISMAGFNADPASEDHVLLTALLGQLEDGALVSAAQRVVLDVRGNSGGSSHWSREIASRMWGDAAMEAVAGGSHAVDWRVSERNLADIRSFRDMLLAQESPDPEMLRWSGIILDGMTAALERGEALWRQPKAVDEPADEPAPDRPRRLRANAEVIVLTDSSCASACLDALDLWLPLGAIHAGAETSADTVYMEVGGQKLPSGLSRIGLPMKVYRGRPRGINQPYVPVYPFPGPMGEAALEAWIRSLPPSGTGS